ncbi:MAG: TlpA family protein disulfide reductase [Bacteroidales bacterium]|jgi:thiol-disulfide isomerase/thioredoxin|nr:TlpA family protein disulfide reductase [Bacteroidales bacterium]
MKKNLFLVTGILISIIFMLISCVGNKAKLMVNVAPIKEGNMELRYITPQQNEGDAVNVLYKGDYKNGRIEITLDNVQYLDGRKDCMLFIYDNERRNGTSLPVVLEKGRTITINIPEDNNKTITYSGTKQCEYFNELWHVLQTESKNMQQRGANLNSSYANLQKAFKKYIDEYPNAEISYMLLSILVKNMQEETENPLLAYCNELCLESQSKNQWKNTFCDVLKNLQLAKITATRLVFTASDKDGKVYSERDIKGKYILVDFWASWCKPCKAEIPHLKELYAKYKSKGLEIVSISMDRNPKEWNSYLERNPFPWLSLIGDGQTLSERYGIEYIPFNLICDEEGNVLNKNLHGEQLNAAIKTFFDK